MTPNTDRLRQEDSMAVVNRQSVLDALTNLSDVSFLLTMSAAQGVARATAAAIVDDPTPEQAFVDAVTAWQLGISAKEQR